MFIWSPNRNMTGKARVFIFLSLPSLSSSAQVSTVTAQPCVPTSAAFCMSASPSLHPTQRWNKFKSSPGSHYFFPCCVSSEPPFFFLLFLYIRVLFRSCMPCRLTGAVKVALQWLSQKLLNFLIFRAALTPCCDVSVSLWKRRGVCVNVGLEKVIDKCCCFRG